MTQDKTVVTNEHLKQNSSSDTPDDVRQRRRLAELDAEHAKEHKAETKKDKK
ncbi:MAG: hypothetical protein P4L33_07085 [Capsulimonadaceae bacterium]|nr:hypothetical protein [Capsulimonadaceae bacterium]